MAFTRNSLLALLLITGHAAATPDDDEYGYTKARELAIGGQRTRAIGMLTAHVQQSPEDTDARVLLGSVLSWEGRYDEARTHLEYVLARNANHGDALPALINVELWSDHPERADHLASRALEKQPNDTGLMLARAKALRAMGKDDELRGTLDQILRLDAHNQEASAMSNSLDERSRKWQVSTSYAYDWFSDNRDPWHEASFNLKRVTPVGPVIGRVSYARRFGSTDEQYDADFYPKFRPGTYAYLNAGFSPDHALYPRYRYGAEIYQSVGWGLEPSLGFRHLEFESSVTIYVATLTKYWGDWAFIGRLYITPGSAGTSRSGHLAARRYFDDGVSYVGLRYGRGASAEEINTLDDIAILDSDVIAADALIALGDRWELTLLASMGREDRFSKSDLYHYSVSAGIGFRF